MAKFQCLQCGRCCRGSGYVWLTLQESYNIAQFLSLDDETFQNKYVQKLQRGLCLKNNLQGDCIFYKNGCSIYPYRPEQCRTFPFWDHVPPEDLRIMLEDCPACQGKIPEM